MNVRLSLRQARIGILAAALTASVGAHAQTDTLDNQLTVGLNYLSHGEIRDGGLPKPASSDVVVEDQANFMMGRMRLTAAYHTKGLEAKAVAQNLAVWGAKGNTTLTLYEAWAKLKTRWGAYAQVGRIPLSYDDERILGPNDWAMAAMSHDMLRLAYEGKHHKIHLLLAYNQNNENLTTGTYYTNGAQAYKTMHVLWYHYDMPKVPLGVSLLGMNIGLQAGTNGVDAHTEYQQLVGGYITYQPHRWKVEGSYYCQMGHNEHESKIDTWMASGKAAYLLTDKTKLEVGYDYLSGDDYVAVPKPGTMGLPRHDVFKGFNTLYGSRHKFFGVMDYFYESAYLNEFTPGLQNAFVAGYFKPTTALTCKAAYHYMATATKLEKLERTLGHDIELEAAYRFSKNVRLTAGVSYMLGTETIDRLKQGNNNKTVRWGWFSLIISPQLWTTRF